MSNLSERLSELLKESGLTAKDLAVELSMSPTTLRKWINFDADPYLRHLVKVADFFGCSIEYLVGRSDDQSKSNFKMPPPFGVQLRKVVDESPYTIYEVCQKTSFAYHCFWDWFHGQEPRLSSLKQLADVYKCTIDEFIGRV